MDKGGVFMRLFPVYSSARVSKEYGHDPDADTTNWRTKCRKCGEYLDEGIVWCKKTHKPGTPWWDKENTE